MGGQTHLRAIARMEPVPSFFGSQCPQSAPAISVIQPRHSAGPVWARWGWRVGLERKDRPEFGSVILPFVGWLSSNCVQEAAVLTTGGVDRLLEAELAPIVEFVIESSREHLAHAHWQGRASEAGIVEVTIHTWSLPMSK